mgnify:FL=1
MIARCGEVRVWHWAHRSRRHCDPWWENETEWHRNWKEHFPADWQEIVHHAEDGERHIADVKTKDEWVIEIQHSYIKPEERRSREGFYQKLVWIVDGVRRKRDPAGFQKAWEHTVATIGPNAPIRQIWRHEGALMRDWAGGSSHVFFDFGDGQVLYWLLPGADDTWAWIARIPRAEFINAHQRMGTVEARDFDSFVEALTGLISDYENYRRGQVSNPTHRGLDHFIRRPPRRRPRRSRF